MIINIKIKNFSFAIFTSFLYFLVYTYKWYLTVFSFLYLTYFT